MSWADLTTAPDQLTAEMWRDLLREEGIPAMIDPRDVISFLGVSPRACRLKVPEGMVREAQAVLARYRESEP